MTTVRPDPPKTWGRMTMCESLGPTHAFLEHPGELRLIVRGRSLGELAAEGGRALGLRLLGPHPGSTESWLDLEIRAPNQEAVLGGWLNRLLALARRDGWAPVECELIQVTDRCLRGWVRGLSLPTPCGIASATIRPDSRLSPDGTDLLADVLLRGRRPSPPRRC